MVGDEFANKFQGSLTNKEGRINRNVGDVTNIFPRTVQQSFSQMEQRYRQRHRQYLVVHGHFYLAKSNQTPGVESTALKNVTEDTLDTFDGLVRSSIKFTLENCVDNSAPRAIKIFKLNKRLLILDSFHCRYYEILFMRYYFGKYGLTGGSQ